MQFEQHCLRTFYSNMLSNIKQGSLSAAPLFPEFSELILQQALPQQSQRRSHSRLSYLHTVSGE